MKLLPRGSIGRCAFCHADLEQAWTCGACGTRLHEECLASMMRCPTLGCSAATKRPLRVTLVARPWVRPPARWRGRLAMVLALIWIASVWIRASQPRWHWLSYDSGPEDVAFVTSKGYVVGRFVDFMRVWSLEDSRDVARFGEKGRFLALSPGGESVASGRHVYSLPEGRVLLDLPAGFDAMAFAPDGKRILGSYGSSEALVSAATGEIVLELETVCDAWQERSAFLFSPDGGRVAALVHVKGEADGIGLWSTANGRLQRRLSVGDAYAFGAELSFTPLGQLAYGNPYGAPDAVRIFDPDKGVEIPSVRLERPYTFLHSVFHVGLSPTLAATGSSSGGLRVVSLRDGSVRFETSHSGNVALIRFSSDGRYVATGGSEDVTVWEIPP